MGINTRSAWISGIGGLGAVEIVLNDEEAEEVGITAGGRGRVPGKRR